MTRPIFWKVSWEREGICDKLFWIFLLFVKEVWKDAEVSFSVTVSLASPLSDLEVPHVTQDKEKNNRLRLDRIRSYWPRDNSLIYNLNAPSFLLEYTYKRTSLFWFQSKVIAVALMRQNVGTNATGGNFEL